MPLGETLDDDYIVNLLKSDATRITSTRPRAKDAPKPNIRFLRNVIRETDSHNAALKAKEAEDARVKLQELKRQERSGGGKRKRDDEHEGRAEKKPRSGERNGRWASALGGLGKVRSTEREGRAEIKVKGAAAESGKRRRDDERERRGEDERRTKKQQQPEQSSRPSERKRSRERRSRNESGKERSRSPQRRGKVNHRSAVRDEVNSDSDPLESIIGPKPAPTVRPRGRGAQNAYVSSKSTIDARFAADYDPSADIHPDHDVDGGEEDDWDMALSALQARTRFKVSQKERLKSAGFTEEEVGRWEKGGKVHGEKDVGDVRWKKKGEGREWDAGKASDEEGRLETKVAWAK
ncbi:hypothetical protein LTS10_008400 [Elasticomyces elasticus]|nr:hypothetical protein LTS10_008400 [Elasticomyces elasticus]